MGTSYLFVLAAVLNSHNSIRNMSSTDLSMVSWVDSCNYYVYHVLFEKFAVGLVSSPEYLGLVSILQVKQLDRWERFQILRILGYPLLVIDNTGFMVDCPNYLDIHLKSRENIDLDLATIAMQFNIPKSDVCIHVWVV